MSMRSSGIHLASLLVAAALGFGLARWTAPALPAEEVMRRLDAQEALLEALASRLDTPAVTSPQPGPRSVVGVDLSGIRDELRQMLREELRTVAASPAAEAQPKNREPAQPSASPENLAAFQEARRLVDDSLASQHWGDKQREEFRTLRGRLADRQYFGLVRELVTAFNNRQVQVKTSGPPF
jgi:hypothetical protein